jgi:alpha-tubulin suppressor-like RCC1 family protein
MAYWPFDETKGIVTRDATTNHFPGTLRNRPRRVPSYWLPVLTLNGANPVINQYGVPFVDPGATVKVSAVAVAADYLHSLMLRADGTVVGWGTLVGYKDYNSGETTIPQNATNVIAIAAGGAHDLALRLDGSVVAWGNNGAGETNVPAGATNIVDVAAGASFCLALTADGTVLAWGDNSYGEIDVPADATNVVAIQDSSR